MSDSVLSRVYQPSLLWFSSIDSTMDQAVYCLKQYLPSCNNDHAHHQEHQSDINFWVVTDRQTKGRGRHGRVWHDGEGNFMGTYVLPKLTHATQDHMNNLPIMVGIGVKQTIELLTPREVKSNLAIKHPNDVVVIIDNVMHKIAGVLIEVVQGHILIGIGVNLVHKPRMGKDSGSLLPPASLLDLVGNKDPVPALIFFYHLRSCIESVIDIWRASDVAFIETYIKQHNIIDHQLHS